MLWKKMVPRFCVASNFIQINKIWKQWNKDVLQILDVLELIMEDIGLFLMGESMVGAKRKSFFRRELFDYGRNLLHIAPEKWWLEDNFPIWTSGGWSYKFPDLKFGYFSPGR